MYPLSEEEEEEDELLLPFLVMLREKEMVVGKKGGLVELARFYINEPLSLHNTRFSVFQTLSLCSFNLNCNCDHESGKVEVILPHMSVTSDIFSVDSIHGSELPRPPGRPNFVHLAPGDRGEGLLPVFFESTCLSRSLWWRTHS